MELNFNILKEELVNFHMNHITKTKEYKAAVIGNTIFMILFLLLFIILLSKVLYLAIAFFIEWIVLLLFRKKIMLSMLRKRLRKIYSYEKYNGYFESTKLTMNGEGLNLTTKLSKKTYNWTSIRDIHLIDNYIFIRTFTHDDILIPVSSFVSSEDEKLFLSTITENTNLQLKNKYPVDFKYQ